jgi:hypothetical protein
MDRNVLMGGFVEHKCHPTAVGERPKNSPGFSGGFWDFHPIPVGEKKVLSIDKFKFFFARSQRY